MFNTLLNNFTLNNGFAHKAALALITIALLMFFGCGKRKPPLPPVERVPQRLEINGRQQGSQVTLYWKMPARNAPDGSVLSINKIDVYRLIEPVTSPLSLSEEEFSSRSTLIASIPISKDDFGLKTLTFSDQLEFAGQDSRLRYAVRLVNSSGQKAAFSNFLLIEPSAKIAQPSSDLSVTIFQDKIRLSWTAPKKNVDDSTPPNVLGFNVYRSADENEEARLLNKNPVTNTFYEDEFFEFAKRYKYFVRTVSIGSSGQPIESLNSEIIEVVPVDRFSPTPPSAITIAASPGAISLFFATNPEKDIGGYNIFRSTDPLLPKSEWQRLNTEPLKNNTFQDTKVESKVKYFYYIVALDKFGNTSDPSEVISETAF